ncbi:MAG: DUF2007 domain-containing protein [Pseudomonadaceae bacterium]|nr:MAG: DUF2007 domain-containing protein [Pseudomonadaceae bacterium]
MLCAYHPRDMIEGELLRQMLAEQHVPCHLSGQYLQGAIGELPVHDLLGLWVQPEDLGLARELIRDYQSATPIFPEEQEDDA